MTHPGGRPSKYTEDIADEICARMSDGESLSSICRDDHIPHRITVHRWLNSTETILPDVPQEFRNRYAQARVLRAEKYSDEIIEIADGAAVAADALGEEAADFAEEHKADAYRRAYNEEIQARRLRIDSRKWYSARCDPEHWGDKTDINLKGRLEQQVERTTIPVHNLSPEDQETFRGLARKAAMKGGVDSE